jgi:hypothetical protein
MLITCVSEILHAPWPLMPSMLGYRVRGSSVAGHNDVSIKLTNQKVNTGIWQPCLITDNLQIVRLKIVINRDRCKCTLSEISATPRAQFQPIGICGLTLRTAIICGEDLWLVHPPSVA